MESKVGVFTERSTIIEAWGAAQLSANRMRTFGFEFSAFSDVVNNETNRENQPVAQRFMVMESILQKLA